MKIDKDYIMQNKDKISNTFYGVCLFDTLLSNKDNSRKTNCYKSLIYKFSNNKELIKEYPKIDMDKNTVYEEELFPMTEDEYFNFKIIGRLPELIDYLENGYN